MLLVGVVIASPDGITELTLSDWIVECPLPWSNASIECVGSGTGRTVCNNGQEVGGHNANWGMTWESERNQADVSTT
jgi:hypothetical protein